MKETERKGESKDLLRSGNLVCVCAGTADILECSSRHNILRFSVCVEIVRIYRQTEINIKI